MIFAFIYFVGNAQYIILQSCRRALGYETYQWDKFNKDSYRPGKWLKDN